ncbi:MAG TPA: carbohydrate ABC transporter permease [Candidatus Marinimicrobia bacterium]|jgi:arabinogalactan oligomer/maltooligosaccharide transport system permease protein|nr:ABC transporter [Candidatus Neomarinimicrobiota bacterium]MDP6143742.1 carbohydrate ABC transporter permease [Candidatus Neomarinimicrobiota bacterium]MDP6261479.1 carbohydrate ABC transporter permease [Candidatus Neomarinimicrobiota bacterium]MEE1506618.1 carbohydrate ABC transporter permease [Candidatus Neomarinimicrobiota bacterium]MEE1573243.1 carbohydrate ABC transporter permease [Candidatus Neomarinimicrobiota bacterium]|tara:strand:+ start:292 stop:1119 length:828 start_codon:yes stop_codon:yes gene_type:complete
MSKKIETLFIFSFLVLFTLATLYPALNIIGISLRTDDAFQSRSLALWTSESSFRSYVTLFLKTDFLTWMKNSFLVSFVVTLTGVVLASTSGYALSRFNFMGRRAVLSSLLMTQMFPATMLLLPFFILLAKLKLINSYLGLIIIYSSTALPFCIWQMKGYYDTIPDALEEAARIDGCSRFSAFTKVILPVSAPALVITALFSFMASWSEYVVAAIVLQDPGLYTLPLGLKSFQASLSTQWGLYAAGAVVVSIPVMILFISLSRFLVSGLTVGSVKG